MMIYSYRRIKDKKTGGYVYKRMKSKILKEGLKSAQFYPGHEEQDALSKGKYVESILFTALRIENNLKELYFRKHCTNNVGIYLELRDETRFASILRLTCAVKIISSKEYDLLNSLKAARNVLFFGQRSWQEQS